MTAGPIKLAVFGQPVAHSLSPRIHRLFGEQLGLELDYSAIESGVHELPERLATFFAEGGRGANLTVPLKAAGLELCTVTAPSARLSGAVNTLKHAPDGWHGYNTDGAGLLLDLDRLGIDPAGKRILILGAGGACAGILEALTSRSPAAISVLNRSPERARRLVGQLRHRGILYGGGFQDAPTLPAHDLLIQSTSAGHADRLPPLDRAWLSATATAYDLNYGTSHRLFADWCRDAGVPVADGLGMLIAQAALSFEIWTGTHPRIGPVLDGLRAR